MQSLSLLPVAPKTKSVWLPAHVPSTANAVLTGSIGLHVARSMTPIPTGPGPVNQSSALAVATRSPSISKLATVPATPVASGGHPGDVKMERSVGAGNGWAGVSVWAAIGAADVTAARIVAQRQPIRM